MPCCCCCLSVTSSRKRPRNPGPHTHTQTEKENCYHGGKVRSKASSLRILGAWFVVVLVASHGAQTTWGLHNVHTQPMKFPVAGITSRSAARTTCYFSSNAGISTLSPAIEEEAPWLANDNIIVSNNSTLQQQPQQQQEQLQEELQWLQWTLVDRQQLSEEVVEEVLQVIHVACQGNVERMLGCIDFLQTLLRLEQVATPAVLFASILHFGECVAGARTDGVYDTVRQRLTLVGSTSSALERISEHRLALLPSSSLLEEDEDEEDDSEGSSRSLKAHRERRSQKSASNNKGGLILPCPTQDNPNKLSSFLSEPLTPEVLQISNGASRIKQAEIVAEIVLPRQADYEKVQNLLVSVSGDDWRALAIRCVASLYQLEGGLQSPSQFQSRNPQAIASARYAIHVYAPLAQRMGLHVLKTQLESKAFSVLYPRQYKAALALFDRQGDSMLAVSRYLQQQVVQLLQQDPNLATTDIQVTARVKEPYSFWKKLLRKNRSRSKGTGRSMILRFDSELSRREINSILQVRDGVALRVIVQAPPLLDRDESSDERRTRDQLVCYYVHQLIRAVFPETDPRRVKDYIQFPKANGYQSLHHTSVIRMDQLEIPFEVQVRSQEMHQIAEFGFAAHWDYKQQKQQPTSLQSPVSQSNVLALSPAAQSVLISSPAESGSHDVETTITVDHEVAVPTISSDEPEGAPDNNTLQVSPSAGISSPYLQALEVARLSLVESSVFVFLAGSTRMEHGQLVVVQKGERILDIWKNLQENNDASPPSKSLQAWRNGRLADWGEQVQNGDVLLFQQEETRRTSKSRNLQLRKSSASTSTSSLTRRTAK